MSNFNVNGKMNYLSTSFNTSTFTYTAAVNDGVIVNLDSVNVKNLVEA